MPQRLDSRVHGSNMICGCDSNSVSRWTLGLYQQFFWKNGMLSSLWINTIPLVQVLNGNMWRKEEIIICFMTSCFNWGITSLFYLNQQFISLFFPNHWHSVQRRIVPAALQTRWCSDVQLHRWVNQFLQILFTCHTPSSTQMH